MEKIGQKIAEGKRLLPEIDRVGSGAQPFESMADSARNRESKTISQKTGQEKECSNRNDNELYLKTEKHRDQGTAASDETNPNHGDDQQGREFCKPLAAVLAEKAEHHWPDSKLEAIFAVV